jgi:hypothetical protein
VVVNHKDVERRFISLSPLLERADAPLLFVVMELETRRISAPERDLSPNSGGTMQQFREALPGDHRYRFVIHDRDSIFSTGLD